MAKAGSVAVVIRHLVSRTGPHVTCHSCVGAQRCLHHPGSPLFHSPLPFLLSPCLLRACTKSRAFSPASGRVVTRKVVEGGWPRTTQEMLLTAEPRTYMCMYASTVHAHARRDAVTENYEKEKREQMQRSAAYCSAEHTAECGVGKGPDRARVWCCVSLFMGKIVWPK